ncbi:MAG: hypothetical protein LUH36_05275 [Oscillospiraceae bacterium]|nr:hypothetical protein [Oscillospiraceae bacterium]
MTASQYQTITEQTVQDILTLDDVTAATGVLELSATVTTGSYSASLTVLGIGRDYLTLDFQTGALFPESSAMPRLILSQNAAKEFIDPDDPPTGGETYEPDIDWLDADFTLRTGDSTIPAAVSGIYTDEDAGAAYMDLSLAKELAGTTTYSYALVRITDTGAAELVSAAIAALGYVVTDESAAPEEEWAANAERATYLTALALALLLSAALIKRIDMLHNQIENAGLRRDMLWMGAEEAALRQAARRREALLILAAAGLAAAVFLIANSI